MSEGDTTISTDGPPTTGERPCFNCGYDTRGIDTTGVCPECGKRIAHSLGFRPLDQADPLFVQACAIGITLLIVSFAVVLLRDVEYLFYGPSDENVSNLRYWVASIINGLLLLEPIALWFLLAPERYGRVVFDRGGRSSLLRAIAITCALRLTWLPLNYSKGGHLTFAALAILLHMLTYFRLRDLATRGQPRLVQLASIVLAVNITAIAFLDVIPTLVNVPQVPQLLAAIGGPGVTIFTIAIWWKFRRMLLDAAQNARDNWRNNLSQADADSA